MPDALTERQALLTLNALAGVGPIAVNSLLDALGDPGAVLAADRRKLEAIAGPAAAEAILGARERFDAAKEEARMQKSGVLFTARAEDAYPALLREIHDPPAGVYRKGPYAFDTPCIALVGSRRATVYGESVARTLASQLAGLGFCVVSGLSRGVDTAAHEGALAARGPTVAVLPGGIDVIHPAENLDLYRRISERGALVSEFPFGRAPDPDSLDMRSRVISGLCEAVVVVESDTRGGAMVTARFAGEQGRLLFAVPGRIDQSMSSGCHQLIRDGATLLTRVDDLLQELQYLGGHRPAPPAAPA